MANHTSKQYDGVVDRSRTLFYHKNRDYGSAWRILRPSSLTDQLFIKAMRIRSIQESGGVQMIDESSEVEFIAIVNYCVMALIQLSEPVGENWDMDTDLLMDKYDQWIRATKDLMTSKNHDYGEAWRDMRVSSMTDLILMKLLRIKSIEDNDGKTVVSEGLSANYQDILNYAIFALIKMSEK